MDGIDAAAHWLKSLSEDELDAVLGALAGG